MRSREFLFVAGFVLLGCSGGDGDPVDSGAPDAASDAAAMDAGVDAARVGVDSGPAADPYSECGMDPMTCIQVGGSGFIDITPCAADGSCPAPTSGTAVPVCESDAPPPFRSGMCLLPCSTPGEQAECPDEMVCFVASIPGPENVCGWTFRDGSCLALGPAVCDLVPNCGCGPGACDLRPGSSGSGETDCRPPGPAPTLGGCAAPEDCGPGDTCVGQPTGLCRAFCLEDADCGTGGTCRQLRSGAPPAPLVPGAFVCTTPCNLFDPSDDTAPFQGCPEGVGCRVRDVEGASNITDCGVANATLTEGDACTAFCAVGLMCLPDASDASRCQAPCIIGGAACAMGTCETLGATVEGMGELGYCRLPGA